MRAARSPDPRDWGWADPDAVRARERGLALAARVNRWLIAGAVGLAAALSALTAHAFHPRSAVGATARTSASPAGQQDEGGAPAASPALTPPAGAPSPAPAPAPTPAPVASGGS